MIWCIKWAVSPLNDQHWLFVINKPFPWILNDLFILKLSFKLVWVNWFTSTNESISVSLFKCHYMINDNKCHSYHLWGIKISLESPGLKMSTWVTLRTHFLNTAICAETKCTPSLPDPTHQPYCLEQELLGDQDNGTPHCVILWKWLLIKPFHSYIF